MQLGALTLHWSQFTSNTTDSQGGRQRDSRIGDCPLSRDERTLRLSIDTSAVVNPAQYTFGNYARSLIRDPELLNSDLILREESPLH